jgi:hypothetical protein
MGQYYKPVNLDKREFLYSWDYDNGLKLMEHSWLTNPFVEIVMNLIGPGGAWEKNRLVWAGDYDDEGKYPEFTDTPGNLYSMCCVDGGSVFNLISPSPIDHPEYRYIINHDKNVYVDLKDLLFSYEGLNWTVHPLPILLCSSNGRGNGDYHGKNGKKLVGSWEGNRVSSSFERPSKMKKLKITFKDN